MWNIYLFTYHDIGLPTYCVAVMIRLQASNRAVVNRLCNRKIALSVCTSCNLKYSLSPPSNLYMIVWIYLIVYSHRRFQSIDTIVHKRLSTLLRLSFIVNWTETTKKTNSQNLPLFYEKICTQLSPLYLGRLNYINAWWCCKYTGNVKV